MNRSTDDRAPFRHAAAHHAAAHHAAAHHDGEPMRNRQATGPSALPARTSGRSIASLALVGLLALSSGLDGVAHADQVVLVPVADNTLIEDPNGAFSAGRASYFFAGRVGNNGGTTKRRGAIRFDLSSIPAGSTVTSVTLRLVCSAAGSTTSQTISLRRMNASWGEGASLAFGGGGAPSEPGDATWVHRFYPSTTWATAGGQFNATASASRAVAGTGTYTWSSTTQLVADVQGWVNNPATNFGWLVQGNETTLQSVKRFDSREAGAMMRPQLTVVYTPPVSNPADLNNDSVVNSADLGILLSSWGGTGVADIDQSGTVDSADLGVLLSAWTV
jgi:hypothetical protein